MDDAILYWNESRPRGEQGEPHAPEGRADGAAPQRPCPRHRAPGHVRRLRGRLAQPADPPPYLPGLPVVPAGASVAAAVAAAAHTTLSALYPSQQATFNAKRDLAGLMGSATQLNDGAAFGRTVAQAVLADRAGDPGAGSAGSAGSAGYAYSTARGHHRVDPDNPDQGMHGPFFGAQAKCFSVITRHGLDKPAELDNADYRQALRQVRGKGIAPQLMGTLPSNVSRRTPEETVMGLFWAYDGASKLGTPPRLYNQIVRQVAVQQGNTAAENARLFALVNVAMADAGILA